MTRTCFGRWGLIDWLADRHALLHQAFIYVFQQKHNSEYNIGSSTQILSLYSEAVVIQFINNVPISIQALEITFFPKDKSGISENKFCEDKYKKMIGSCLSGHLSVEIVIIIR